MTEIQKILTLYYYGDILSNDDVYTLVDCLKRIQDRWVCCGPGEEIEDLLYDTFGSPTY